MDNKRYSKRRYSKKCNKLQLFLLVSLACVYKNDFSKNQILFKVYSKWLLVVFCLIFLCKTMIDNFRIK